MTTVFADAAYWIAILRSADQWHGPALKARAQLGEATLVTTEEALTEALTGLCGYGGALREQAAGMVRDIMARPEVRVIPQTHDGFLAGLDRYERRPDKEYSLQDCIAMNVMDAEGITDILTSDHHFEQEGFTILMRRG